MKNASSRSSSFVANFFFKALFMFVGSTLVTLICNLILTLAAKVAPCDFNLKIHLNIRKLMKSEQRKMLNGR